MKTKWKIILILSLLACVGIIIVVYISSSPSRPQSSLPDTHEVVNSPNIPSGPSTGYVGQSLTYTVGGASSSKDYSIKYYIEWGDGTYSESGFAGSESISLSHTWHSPGTYYVRAKAISTSGVSSSWADSKLVTIERVKHEKILGTLKEYTLAGQYWYYWSEYIEAGKQLSISWEADGAVSVYILTETQYDYFKDWGFSERYIAYDQATRGTLSREIRNADTYYIVIKNPSLFGTFKIYSAEAKVTWWS